MSIIRPLLALSRFDFGLCGGAGAEAGWAFRGFRAARLEARFVKKGPGVLDKGCGSVHNLASLLQVLRRIFKNLNNR